MSSVPASGDSMLKLFKAGLEQSRKERKTNDILEFIKKHYRLFCGSRSKMEGLFDEMQQQGDENLDTLANMLGLPESVLFKRVKAMDTAKTFLHPLTSPLYKQFIKTRDERQSAHKKYDPELCIIFVAGESSLIITNMQTRSVEGLVHVFVGAGDGHKNVNIFKAEDAPMRIPELFYHEGDE